MEEVSQFANEPFATVVAPAPASVTPVVCQPEAASNPGAHSTTKFWKLTPPAVPVTGITTPFLNVVGDVGEGGGTGLKMAAFCGLAKAGTKANCFADVGDRA